MIYRGRTFLNCASGDEKNALAEDSAFGKTLRDAYSTDFSDVTGLFNELHTSLAGIVARGPSQTGMAPAEEAARRSEIINQAAASNKQLQAEIGEFAGRGSAAPGAESGVVQTLREQAAAEVEGKLADQQANITEKNYELGRQNYERAVAGEEELPKVLAPATQAGEAVTEANKLSTEAAKNVAESANSWMGVVGGIAKSAVGGLTGGLSNAISNIGKGGGSDSTSTDE